MNQIKKVIEESLKEETINSLLWYAHGHIEPTEESMIRMVASIKSHLSTTISSILDAIEAEVEEVGNDVTKSKHSALSDIQELLKSAKEKLT